jgi:hypothetical protein
MSPLLDEYAYDIINELAGHIPENYRRSGDSIDATSPEINPKDVFSQQRVYKPAPLMKLQENARKFYTPKPILVNIYRDGELFFAENENLVVCGTGHTRKEALEDLSLHIIHFFEYYNKLDKSELIGDALRLKELYQNLLVEIEE